MSDDDIANGLLEIAYAIRYLAETFEGVELPPKTPPKVPVRTVFVEVDGVPRQFRSKLPAPIVQDIVRAHREGRNLTAIARLTGTSRYLVRRTLEGLGLL